MRRSTLGRLFACILLAFALAGFAACGDDEAAVDCADPNREEARAGALAFAEACCADAECEDGTCAEFKQKGTLCSKTCSSDADCKGAGPSEKCGGQGVCKVD
jgi:hypothetical protein